LFATIRSAKVVKKRDRKKEPAGQKKMVERWNESHPIGTPVTVTRDSGETKETKTRSEAWMLGQSSRSQGHTAVVLVEGIAGCYSLERVKPR
jgi:hypothetical protein